MEAWNSEHAADAALGTHRHRRGYVALIEAGGYAETSVDGIYECRTGVAVVHPPWHLHGNDFRQATTRVLNLDHAEDVPYRAFELGAHRFGQACRLTDAYEVLELLEAHGRPLAGRILPPRVAAMAEELSARPSTRIDALAEALRISPEHASREFRRHTGFSPAGFRAEHRLRGALSALRAAARPVDVAVDHGYSDQSHLSRTVKAATGLTVSQLRASDSFKT